MRKYYTRPCNFYHGRAANSLIKLKKAFPEINHFVVDERLTSKLAKRFLNQSEKKKQRGNKKNVDKISASIILENFLIGLN